MVNTFSETFNGFLNNYSRMTERCADFICTLALETSCEGAARVCKYLGIKISGDTIIRLLKKRFTQMEIEPTGDCIGIDDFSIKVRLILFFLYFCFIIIFSVVRMKEIKNCFFNINFIISF